MAKFKVKEIKWPKAKSWTTTAIISLVLGVLVLIDKGSVSSSSGLSAPCRVEVTADVLSVRSSPDPNGRQVATLRRGDLRGAQPVVQNGYRQLGGNEWALDEFLRPLPGSRCTTP